jgi:hypothetical protein
VGHLLEFPDDGRMGGILQRLRGASRRLVHCGTAAALALLASIAPLPAGSGPAPVFAAEGGKAAIPGVSAKAPVCEDDYLVSLHQGGKVILHVIADERIEPDAMGRYHLALKERSDIPFVGEGLPPDLVPGGAVVDIYPSSDTTVVIVALPGENCVPEGTTRGTQP